MRAAAIMLIAAMLISPIAMVLSISTTTAQADVSMTVEPNLVKGGARREVFTLSVTNNTSSVITKVVLQIKKDDTVQSWDLKGVAVIPAGENLHLADDNKVYVAPDNELTLLAEVDNQKIYIVSGTELWIPGGATIYLERQEKSVTLNADENIKVTVPGTDNSVGLSENQENLAVGTKIAPAVLIPFYLDDDNKVQTKENVYIYWYDRDDNLAVLIENTYLKVTAQNDNALYVSAGENKIKLLGDNEFILKENRVSALEAKTDIGGTTLDVEVGDNIQISDNKVKILAGQSIQVAENIQVRIGADNYVLRVKDTKVVIDNKDKVVSVPAGWDPDQGGDTLTWTADGSDNLDPGDTLSFKFSADLTTAATGTYTVVAGFYDASNNLIGTKEYSIEVDNTPPTVTAVSVNGQDYVWVKEDASVAIRITFSETISSIENIRLVENYNVTPREWVQLEDNFAPVDSENKIWEATYVTGDNENRDGPIRLEIISVKDKVGNDLDAQVDYENIIFVDRRAPPAKKLSTIMGAAQWPTDSILTKDSFNIKIDKDDIKDNYQGVENENTVEAVKIKVDNTEYAMSYDSFADKWYLNLEDLSEGKHRIAIVVQDKAGNVSEENWDNLYVDLNPPSVSITVETASGTQVSNGGYATENELTIKVHFSDSLLGIDNLGNTTPTWDLFENFRENENWDRGWVVVLTYENGDNVPGMPNPLVPKTPPKLENEENVVSGVFLSFDFENSTIALPEGNYVVQVYAGDSDNYAGRGSPHRAAENFSFKINVQPPSAPTLSTTSKAYQTYNNPQNPYTSRTYSYYIDGTVTESDVTQVKIYILDSTGNVLDTIPLSVSNRTWSTTLDLSGYQGQVVRIEVSTVDVAGNESTSRTLYGYFLYDASAPTVTIDSQYKNITTDKASIVISGSVQIDDWESYADITLTVSPSTASVVFDQSTGTFSVSVPLSEGQNLVAVTATDAVGNSGSDSATITRTVTPWATYAIVIVIIALILAAIAIFRRT